MKRNRTPALPISEAFLRERAAFALLHTCEDCAFFAGGDACANGWPTRTHQTAWYQRADGRAMEFCKEFEAGP